MTAHLFLSRGAACLRTLLAAALLWAVASGSALAQVTVSSVTINGSTSTVNVQPGTDVSVAVTYQNGGHLRRNVRFAFFAPGASQPALWYCRAVGNGAGLTRTYSLAVPGGSNLYRLEVSNHDHPNCNLNSGQFDSVPYLFADAVDTRPVAVGVDHLQIEHDGIGRTCGPKTVTVRACANLACSTVYTSATSIKLSANNGASWSVATETQTFSGGTTTALLTKIDAGATTLGGVITSPAFKSATTCLKSGVLGSCDVVFSATSCRLDAVETSKSPGTPIYTKTTAGFSLDVLNLNSSGVLANTTATISAQLVDEASCSGASPTVTPLSPVVSVAFVNASRASFPFAPALASKSARVRIVNGSLIGCSNDKFAIRPASFTLTATGVGADGNGVSGSATPILKAGTTAFTLSAASSAGYGLAPLLNNKRLHAADVSGAGSGSAGILAGTFVAGAGTASGSFTYSEVGYVRLKPYAVYDNGDFALVDSAFGECRLDTDLPDAGDVADANFIDTSGMIGCYFGNAQTLYFGRFIPDRFVLGAATLTDRAGVAGCTAPGFSYMGEAMQASIALTAVNGGGDPTKNYTGLFDRFTSPATRLGINAMNDAPGARTLFPLCGATKAHPCIEAGAASGAFDAGVATFALPLTVFRPTVPVGPYDYLNIGLAPIDIDGVRLDPATYNVDTVTVPTASITKNHVLLKSTKARYGRLNIDNAYGSELLNLSMRVSAQYFKGTGYATNALDSCTPLASTDFTLVDYRGGITPVNMDAGHVTGGTMVGGVGRVVLAKPTPAPTVKGSVVLKSKNTATLPGSGRGTFGVYKAGPVIYVRETY